MQTMPHTVRTALVAERHHALVAAASHRRLAGPPSRPRPTLLAAIRLALTTPRNLAIDTRS